MKLATLRDGTRDGQLVVVSANHKFCHLAHAIAPTLQRALDDWHFIAPQLQALSDQLNAGKARHSFALNPADCMAPLPRAYQWLDASTYTTHIERVLGARNVPVPEHFATDYLMYQGGSDDFLGPHEPAQFVSPKNGIDFEAEIVVVTTRVPMAAGPNECEQHIALIGLANDWSLREVVNHEVPKGFGFLQSKPATSFAPFFVTPDELGLDWVDCKPHLSVSIHWNGARVGRIQSSGMVANFAQLLSHAARTRNLSAGTIIGGGTVSEANDKAGYACIAEQRAKEITTTGQAVTEYVQYDDVVKIEAHNRDGKDIFGAIEQMVLPLTR
jgi:fumarylacetoacetate (FAA) hydrolase